MKTKNKDLNYYMSLNYTIKLVPYGDGSYFAEIVELPGCITEGDNEKEALEMIKDAKKAWISSALEDKVTIPEPVTDEYSGKFNVRVPKSIHRELVYKAHQEGVSLNALISSSLSMMLHEPITKYRNDK